MPSTRARALAFAILAASSDVSPARAGQAPPDLRTVAGEVTAIAWKEGLVTIRGADGPVTLGLDRNTSVFLAARLGTLRDLAAGLHVRAEFGDARRAFWIEVQPRAQRPRDAAEGFASANPPQIPPPPERPGASARPAPQGPGAAASSAAEPPARGPGTTDAGPPAPEPQPPRGTDAPRPGADPGTGPATAGPGRP